jgi:signal transduction histidine kinase
MGLFNMMHDFLTNNSNELVKRCRAKVAERPARGATTTQLANGVPMFLDQLIRTLRAEQIDQPARSVAISGTSAGIASHSEMGVSAAHHGRDLLALGFTVDQVVHDYGDLCQAITDLAFERDAPFQIDEFRTLNRCLDNAIAEAVTEFSYQQESIEKSRREDAFHKQAALLHELRNYISTADLALSALKSGNLATSGATGAVLGRSIAALKGLVGKSIDEVTDQSTIATSAQLFCVADFISEIEAAAALTAAAQGCSLFVSVVDPDLAISADKELLTGALGNLLNNAFKFTHPSTQVSLESYAVAERILIDVKDRCGGLGSDKLDRIFMPFVQAGKDRSGLGLGLSIAKHSVELFVGTLTVRDVPETGCVFTISLPRHTMAPQKRLR